LRTLYELFSPSVPALKGCLSVKNTKGRSLLIFGSMYKLTVFCRPMCFVEFEDVTSAARVMSEMYGHTLGGLVKGGIRLAYR
jgi:hypothetical protein